MHFLLTLLLETDKTDPLTVRLLCPIGEFKTQSGGANASTIERASGFT